MVGRTVGDLVHHWANCWAVMKAVVSVGLWMSCLELKMVENLEYMMAVWWVAHLAVCSVVNSVVRWADLRVARWEIYSVERSVQMKVVCSVLLKVEKMVPLKVGQLAVQKVGQLVLQKV